MVATTEFINMPEASGYCHFFEWILNFAGPQDATQAKNVCYFCAMVIMLTIVHIAVMARKEGSLLSRTMTPCAYPTTAFDWLLILFTMTAYGSVLLFIVYRWIFMDQHPMTDDFLRLARSVGLAYIASGFIATHMILFFRILQQPISKWSKK